MSVHKEMTAEVFISFLLLGRVHGSKKESALKTVALSKKPSITFLWLLNFLQGANQAPVSTQEFRGKPPAFKCAFNRAGSGSVVK